jgi:hypothetical protein
MGQKEKLTEQLEKLTGKKVILKEVEMGPTVELQQALKNMGPEVEDGYYAIGDNILPLLKGLQGQSGISPSQELEDEIKIFYRIYTLFQKSQLGKYL